MFRVRVVNHELAAKYLLELLADYQVVSGWLAITVARTFATLLSLAATAHTPWHNIVVVLGLVGDVHSIPAASGVDVLLASPVRLATNYYQHTLFGNAPTMD